MLDFCRANGLDYILGVAKATTLRARAATLEASTSPLRGGARGRQGPPLQGVTIPASSSRGVYCRRGRAENHIKSWKTRLAADRTSCSKATANQFRLFLHAGAYWLMWGLRAPMPKRSLWRSAQFDTLRLRPIKIAARVVGKR